MTPLVGIGGTLRYVTGSLAAEQIDGQSVDVPLGGFQLAFGAGPVPVKIMFGDRSAIVRVLAAGAFVLAGCSGEETLLAPTGAVLTLATGATALSFNGSTAINARILTSQGQPAPDGTIVRFATTLGTVAPVEVVTAAGVATTNFNAGVASGTAIVTASSGSVGGDNGLRIAIGVAAVARVQVTATPPSISSAAAPASSPPSRSTRATIRWSEFQ